MNSIIKNISKILALTVFSTNFSSMVLASSDGDPAFDSSQVLNNSIRISNSIRIQERLLASLESKRTKLEAHGVYVTDAFMQKVDFDTKWRILHQLNVLFDKYPLFTFCFERFLEFAALPPDAPNVQYNRFEIDIIPPEQQPKPGGIYLGGEVSIWYHFMRFNCAGANATHFKNHIAECGRTLPSKLYSNCSVEFQVAHEFGHCVQEIYCLSDDALKATKERICEDLGPDVERRLGQRWRQPSTRGNPTLQAQEFFADFFAYVQCGADVPAKYKTLLNTIIREWTPR